MSSTAHDGLARAWDILAGLDPEDVCARARVRFDSGRSAYHLNAFGQPLSVSLRSTSISSPSEDGRLLLTVGKDSISLAVLHYLARAHAGENSERLVKPQSLPGGQIYSRGAHVLPLDRVTAAFGGDPSSFEIQAVRWGGERLDFGDASFRIRALPKVPLVVILWEADDEFPARSDLLLSAESGGNLPPDILWALAWTGVSLLLEVSPR